MHCWKLLGVMAAETTLGQYLAFETPHAVFHRVAGFASGRRWVRLELAPSLRSARRIRRRSHEELDLQVSHGEFMPSRRGIHRRAENVWRRLQPGDRLPVQTQLRFARG